MLQQLSQVILRMSSEWMRPALPKVQEWWSEYKMRLGSAVGLGDPEFEVVWPDSTGAACWSVREKSQCVPSAQLRMPVRLQMKQRWWEMYEPHP